MTADDRKAPNELKVVSVRLVREPSLYGGREIHSPRDAAFVMAQELKDYDREAFCIINLKQSGEVINMSLVSLGTLNASLVSTREVFKSSILSNAASIIAVHNHPSGRLLPSAEDLAVTRKLLNAGRLPDIRLLDHIIVAGGTGELLSFEGEGILGSLKNEERSSETDRQR